MTIKKYFKTYHEGPRGLLPMHSSSFPLYQTGAHTQRQADRRTLRIIDSDQEVGRVKILRYTKTYNNILRQTPTCQNNNYKKYIQRQTELFHNIRRHRAVQVLREAITEKSSLFLILSIRGGRGTQESSKWHHLYILVRPKFCGNSPREGGGGALTHIKNCLGTFFLLKFGHTSDIPTHIQFYQPASIAIYIISK